MTPEQIHQLREALYLARQGAERNLDDALRILGEQLLDGTYIYSIVGADVLREAESRASAVFPGAYAEAFSALREELKLAPDVSDNAPEVEDPYVPPIEIPDPDVPDDDFDAKVLRVLSKKGIFIQANKLGVGIVPDADNPAALHIGGAAIASINGVSNVAGTDGQNPGERHSNIFCVCDNDGGMRGIQYGHWFNGQVIRNTTNRRMSIFALFDSMGDNCINDDTGGRGQDFYIVREPERKRVIIGAYKPGWTIEVRETSEGAPYSAMDVRKL